MQSASVRDRLQRCRGELSQVIGLARDLERLEGDRAPGGAGSDRWVGPGPYAATAYPRRESQAAVLLQRIQQAAERCAHMLGDVEREVGGVMPLAAPGGTWSGWQQPSYGGRREYARSGFGPHGGWNREPAFAPRREYAPASGAWEQDSAHTRTGTTRPNGYAWRHRTYEREPAYAGGARSSARY